MTGTLGAGRGDVGAHRRRRARGVLRTARRGRSVEVAHFGLLSAFHGRGLGGWLLTVALRRAQELGDPVWLHTCTLDGPAALPNYLARGMVPYRTETSER